MYAAPLFFRSRTYLQNCTSVRSSFELSIAPKVAHTCRKFPTLEVRRSAQRRFPLGCETTFRTAPPCTLPLIPLDFARSQSCTYVQNTPGFGGVAVSSAAFPFRAKPAFKTAHMCTFSRSSRPIPYIHINNSTSFDLREASLTSLSSLRSLCSLLFLDAFPT